MKWKITRVVVSVMLAVCFFVASNEPIIAQVVGDYRTNGTNQVTGIISGVSTSRFGTAACWDVYTGSKYGWQTATNAPTNQPTSVTMTSLSASSGANILTFTASGANAVTTLPILPGMYVTGTNIPAGTIVTSVDASNGFIYLSANTTGAITNASVTFGWTFTITLGTVSNATSTTQAYTAPTIAPAIGMAVTGTNISGGTYLTSVSGGNLVLSVAPTNTGLVSGQTITVYSLYISTQQTNALNNNTLALAVQNTNIQVGQVMPSAAGLGTLGTMVTGVNSNYTPSVTATASTSSSNTLTLSSTLGIAPGMTITSGVSGGSAPYIVTAVTSNTSVTLNQNVNASNGATINFSTGTLVYTSVKPTGTRVTNTNFNFFTIPNLYINHHTVVDNNVGTTIGNLYVNNTSNAYSNGITPSTTPTLYIGSNSTSAFTLSVATLNVSASARVQSTPNSNSIVNTLNLYGADGGNVIVNNGTIDLTAKTNATTTTVFMGANQNGNMNTAVIGNAISFSTITLNMGWSAGNVVDLQSTAGYTMTSASTSNTLNLNFGTLKISGGASGTPINITPFGTGNNGMTSNTIGNNSINGVSGVTATSVSGNVLTVSSTIGLSIGQYVTSAPNTSITNAGYYISNLTATTLTLSSYNPSAAALATGSYNFGTGAGAGLTLNSPFVTVNAVNPSATGALPTQTFIGFNLTITSAGGTVNWGTTTTPVLLTPVQTGGGGQVNLAGGTLNVFGGYSMYNNGGVTSISGTAQLNLPLTTTQVNTTNYYNGGNYTPFYTLSFGFNNYLFMSGGSINVANHTTTSTPYNCDVFLTSSTGGWNMTGGTININAAAGTTITYFTNRPIFNLAVQNGCTFAPASAALISNTINTFTINGTLTVASNSTFDLGIQTLSVGNGNIAGTGTIATAAVSPFSTVNTFTGTVNYCGGTQTVNNSTFNNLSITGTKSANALTNSLNVTVINRNFIDLGTQSVSSIPLGITLTATGTGAFPANTYIVATVPSVTASATLTNGSTSVTAITSGIVAGMAVSGTGIAAGTYVTSVTGAFGITLSTAATASGTNNLTFNSTLFTNANATAAGSLSNLSFASRLTLAAGTTTVNGVLNVNYTGTIGSFVTTSDTISLATAGSNSSISSPFTIQVLNLTAGDTLTLNNALTINGSLNVSGVLQYNASASLSTAPIFANGSTAVLNIPNYSLATSNEYFWPASNSPTNVTISQPLSLNGQARSIPLSGSLILSSTLTLGSTLTVIGNVQLNNGASISGSPALGTSSTLVYNTGNSYTRGAEWNNPANVTINSGTTLVLGTQAAALTIAGNLTVNGNLTLSTTASPNGDLIIQGNWWRLGSATITQNNNTLIFSGSGNATIGNSSNATETFYNLTINKSTGGGVTLNTPVQVSNILNINGGIVNTSTTNSLTLTNNVQAALTGNFDNNTYINGVFFRRLPQTGSGAYLFPVGVGGVYYPFSITNPTASNTTTTAMVQVSNTNSGGTQDNTTVSVLSTTEYWQLAASGGNLTGGNVSVARTGTVTSPNNLLAYSTSLSGTYSSIGGTASGNNLNNTNSIASINSGNTGYFVLGLYSATPTITSVTGGATATSAYIGQTITIVGANFTAGTTVSINGGAALSTTFINSTQIQLTIPPTATSGNLIANVGGTSTNSFAIGILGYTTKQNGDWSSAATWLGGLVPPTGANTVLAHNTTLTNPGYNAIAGTVTIQSGITLTFGSTDTLSFTTLINNGTIIMNAGGVVQLTGTAPTFTNNGTFTYGTGTVLMNGTASNNIINQNTFYNVTIGGYANINNDTIFGALTTIGNGQYVGIPYGAGPLPSYGAGQTVNIYADPNGSGLGSGASINLPVTLARARIVAQNYPNNPCNIWLKDGIYYQLTLTSADNRTANAPAVYKPVNRGKAIFRPIKVVNRADFQPIPDSIKQRIVDVTAKGKVMQLDLSRYNVSAQTMKTWANVFQDSQRTNPVFYLNTTPLQLARYPNDTTMSMNGVIVKGTNNPDTAGVFYYSDTRTNRWLKAINDEGLWFAGNWRVTFVLQYIKTKTIDTVNKIIYQTNGVQGGIGNKFAPYVGNYKEPYYVSNIFEEIDMEGEYSVNFNNKMLYMWVPDTGTISFADSLTMPAISMAGVSNTQLQNLFFEGGAGGAISASSGSNLKIAGCDVTKCNGDAIVLTDVTKSVVQSNDLHHIGAGGIALYSTTFNTDVNTLKRCNDTIINNYIYDYAQSVPLYNAAIDPGGCIGVYIANNKVRKCPHIGIAFGFGAGGMSTFEYNEVDSVVLKYNDMGAIYGTGKWLDRGHKFNHNYLHDNNDANGLYLDNNTTGDTCVYNIVANAVYGMVNNGGNYNRFFNNIVINCARPVVSNFTADTVIDYQRNFPVVRNLWYNNPTWQTTFPELIDMVDSVNGTNKTFTSQMWSQFKNNAIFTFGPTFNGQTFTYVTDNNLFNADGSTKNTYAQTSDPFTRWGTSFQDNWKVTSRLKSAIYPFVMDSVRTPGILTYAGGTDWHINRIGLYTDAYRSDVSATAVKGIDPYINVTVTSPTNHIFPDTCQITARVVLPNAANCFSSVQFLDKGTPISGLTITKNIVSYDTITYTATWTGAALGNHAITCQLIDSPYWRYTSDSVTFKTDTALTWTGAISTDWGTAGNWSDNRVPTSIDVVAIPTSATRMPLVTGAARVAGRLKVNVGATLTITDSLTLFSDLVLDGNIAGSGSLIVMSTSQTPISRGKNWPLTVKYASVSVQNVVGGNYTHLNINGGNRVLSAVDTIFIGGNFTATTATQTVSNSIVCFNGSGAQTMLNATTLNNVVVNKSNLSSALSLSSPLTVSGNLNLVAGRILTTASNSLTITNTATAAITGGNNNAYVDGPLSRNVLSGSNVYVFPVGNFNGTSQYLPDTINSATSAAVITITAFKANAGGTFNSSLTAISTSDYWSVQSSVANTLSLTITPASLGSNNVIGVSSTANGVYNSLGGLPTATGITSNGLTLTANTPSWVLAAYYPNPIITSVVSCLPGLPAGVFYARDTLTLTGNYFQSSTNITVGGQTATLLLAQSSLPTIVKVLVSANASTGIVQAGATVFNGTFRAGFVTRFDGRWNDGIANNSSLAANNYSIWLGGAQPSGTGFTASINNVVTMASSVSNILNLTINEGANFSTSNIGTTYVSGGSITNNGIYSSNNSSSYTNLTFINNGRATLGGQNFTNVSFTNNAGDSVIIASASVTMSGTITNNGYFKHSSTAMYVNGSLTFTGSNVDTINSLTTLAGTSGTITFTTPPYLTGNFALNSSYTVTGNYPTYAGNGNLYYNTGAPQTIGFEWKPNAASGSGIPVAVRIGNGTAGSSINFSGTNSYRATGAITVTSGCSLTVPNGNSLQSNGLTIAGTVAINDGAQIQSSSTITVTSSGVVNIGSSVLASPATTTSNAALIVTAGSVNDTGTVTNYGYIRLSGSHFNVLGSGSLSMQANSVLEAAYASPAIPTASWNANAYLYLTGITSAAPTNIVQSFGHVIWNSTAQTGNLNITGLNNIAGNFTVLNTGSGSVRLNNTANTYGHLQVGGSAVINGNTINATASTINIGFTTASTTTVNGNITIGNNGTMAAAMPADTLVLSGHWQNSGTFTSANTTVVFKGNTPQNISKTGGETFNNVIIANTGTGVWQNAAITINGTLTFTSGKLFLGDYHCTVSGSSVVNVSGLVTNSYAVMNGTGKWIKQAVGNTATLMPVGTASSYAPLTITHTTGTANDTIGVSATISNAVGDATKIVNLQWSVRPSANVTASIQYQFNSSDGAAAFNVANTCELGSFTNAYQINNVGTPSASGTAYAVSLAAQNLLTTNTYLFVIGNTSAIQCVAGTYVGVAGGDAGNAANWCGGLPTSSTNIILSTNAPQLTGNFTINNLTIASGVNLALNGYQLVVNGTITGSGTLSGGGNASLVVNNGGTLNLSQANPGTSNTLKNLTIGGGTLNIAAPLNIAGFLYPNAGTLSLGNSDITLKSTAIAQTAQVGVVTGAISYSGTGRFVVERFINNNRRGYRNIGSGGVVSDGSIFSNWQENGAQPNGYGMHITGQASSSPGYSNSNGLDYTISGRPSLWTYNTADAFVPVTNTLSPATNQLLPFVGYFAVIRGDRNYDLFSYNPSFTMASTTLRVRGKLATGAITLSSAANPSWNFSGSIASTFRLNANQTPAGKSDANFGYSLVANPYPCAINWNSVWNRSAALCNNRLSKYYWVWNQSLNGNAGGYMTVDNTGITNATLNDNTLQNDHWIQPGQGFFVVNDHSGGDIVLSFDESDKWTTDNNKLKGTFDASNTTTPTYCRMTLKKRAGADTLITDGVVCKFDATYSNAIDINDAGKMSNTADNIAILKDGRALSFECRPYFANADTVAIATWNVSNSDSYLIEIDTRNMATWPVGTYLWDAWKQVKTPITAGTMLQYAWQPGTDSGSFYRRFAIVYNNPVTLPYQTVQLKGMVTANGNQLQWFTAATLPAGTYMTLEQSVNSQSAYKAVYSTKAAAHINQYAYTDTSLFTGEQYYRIRYTIGNQTWYSNTIVLKAIEAEQLSIVQQLAYNHTTAISIQGATANYKAVLVNASGKVLATRVLQHSHGKATYQWLLPSALSSGTYWVQIQRAGKQLMAEPIVIP